MSRLSSFVSLAVVAGLTVPLAVAPSSPGFAVGLNCDDGFPEPAGRVFPEPMESRGYVTFAHFACGIDQLEAAHGDLLDTQIIGETAAGNAQYVVRLTDETVPVEAKRNLLVYSSIHGNEIGAREGAVRQIEDLVDPALVAGEDWVGQLLDEYVIQWFFPNPDGWISGEDGTYSRSNDRGTDLNRNYPITGFIAGQPLSEIESEQAHDYILGQAQPWYLGTDNHGQGGDSYAAAGLQIVGQFDYQKSETLARFADGIAAEMGEQSPTLAALNALNSATGADLGSYHWGTLYDILGYSASGSMIDWFNTPGGVEGVGFATELTAGQQFNQSVHPTFLNQLHVDSIRAINIAMFKQAVDPVTFTYEVGGNVAYVHDPRRIRHDDANGRGYDGSRSGSYDEEPYDVSRMQFLEDLNLHADRPLTAVRVPDVLSGSVDLAAFDSIVLANDAMPESWVRHDAEGAPVGPAPTADPADDAWYETLQAWVEAGGNLVLTDAAIADVLPRFGIVEAGNIYMDLEYVGSVDSFTDRSHPLNAGLRGVASQTFDTVPLGMNFGSPDSAPNWKVDSSAWEAAGGHSAGTHAPNDAGQHDATATIYGEVPLGAGRVRILGALLPDPTEEFFHPFGLQNYAVTYTGYSLLQNMLRWENPARVESTPAPQPAPAPTPQPAPAPLPVTGGGAALLGLVLVGGALWIRRR